MTEWMNKPRPNQWFHFQADLIWPDGPFNVRGFYMLFFIINNITLQPNQ
jgi:hypothetical protein